MILSSRLLGNKDTILSFLFLGLSLFVFRIREYALDQIDFQIIMRLFSWSVMFFVALIYYRKNKFIVRTDAELLFLFSLLLSLIFSVVSLVPVRSVLVVVSYFAFYLFLKTLIDRLGFHMALKCIVDSFFIISLVSLFFYFVIPDLGRHIYWYESEVFISPRMSGVFSTSNAMGGFSGVFFLISSYAYLNHLYDRRFIVSCIVVSFFMLLLTDSRTSIFFSIVCLYFLLNSSRIKVLYWFSFIFVALVVSVIVFFDPFFMLGLIARHGDVSEVFTFTGRTYIWPAVFDMANSRAFTGYGLGVTSVAIPLLSDLIGYSPAHAHNLLLQAYFSLGVFGLLLICYVLFNTALYSRNKLVKSLSFFLIFTGLLEASFLAGVANEMFLCLMIVILFNEYV